jgi:BASS family bile acid:Na+ symporter
LFDHFFLHYADYEYFLASSQLLFAMLGMGALLRPVDFVAVFRRPRELTIGLTLQLLGAPLVALGVILLLPLPAGVAAGVALVASVPGGTLSNVMTHFGRGNIALSISLTAVTTLAALVTTPLLLDLLAGRLMPADFEMPVGRVAFEIAAILLLPLATGMAIGAMWPDRREVFSRWCIRVSLGFILAIVVGGAGAGRLDAMAYGPIGLAAILVFCALLQVSALLAARALRLRAPDRTAVAIELTVRNTNLALMVKASLFPAVAGVADPIGDGMFFVALLYGGAALPLGMIPVVQGRRAARIGAYVAPRRSEA